MISKYININLLHTKAVIIRKCKEEIPTMLAEWTHFDFTKFENKGLYKLSRGIRQHRFYAMI